jgi:hypothetical protein
VTVKNDPRSPATAADLRAQNDLLMKAWDGAREARAGYDQVTAMRAAVTVVTKANPPAEVATAATAFDAKLAAVGGNAAAGGRGGGGGRGAPAGPPPAPNFAALNGVMNRHVTSLEPGDMAPNEPQQRSYLSACGDLKSAVTTWKTINEKDLAAFNAVLAKNNIGKIAAASPVLAVPACSSPPVVAPASGRGGGD